MKKSKVKKEVNIIPLGDRVLVLPDTDTDSKSPSGIIIPDTAQKEKPERGIVVSVGKGKRNENGDFVDMSVSKGDKVVFSKYGYDEVTIDDEEYYIVSENNILAVIK